jgi:hypothetical protein
LIGFLFQQEGSFWKLSSCMLLLELGRWDASERGVEPPGVEPGDVLDDGELELFSSAPDAVADQFGLEAVDETRRGRVVGV